MKLALSLVTDINYKAYVLQLSFLDHSLVPQSNDPDDPCTVFPASAGSPPSLSLSPIKCIEKRPSSPKERERLTLKKGHGDSTPNKVGELGLQASCALYEDTHPCLPGTPGRDRTAAARAGGVP